MESKNYYWLFLLLIVVVWINVATWYRCKQEEPQIEIKEVVKWVAVHDTVPDIRYEKQVRYIPVPDSIFVTDTITKEKMLPIVQRTYTDDSTYTAYVSGVKTDSFPRLDSILVRQKIIERSITQTVYRDKHGVKFKIRPVVGGGYDPFNNRCGAYVGGAVVFDWN